MEERHLLSRGAYQRVGAARDQPLEELDVVQRRLVDRVVLVVTLVNLIRPVEQSRDV